MSSTATSVAFKRASYDRTKKDALVPPKIIEEFKREIDLLNFISCTNIVKLYGVVLEPLGIIMEYMSLGNLNSVLRDNDWRMKLDLKDRVMLALDIAGGLAYIHSKGFMHRDVKLHNILVSKDNSNSSILIAKLCDFGASVQISPGFLTNFNIYTDTDANTNTDPFKHKHKQTYSNTNTNTNIRRILDRRVWHIRIHCP